MGHRPVKRGARLVEIDARRTFGSCGKDGAGGVTGERISGENSRVRIVFDRTGERGSAILIHFVCGGLVHRERLGKMFRSEERRVGKECASTCRSRGSPDY